MVWKFCSGLASVRFALRHCSAAAAGVGSGKGAPSRAGVLLQNLCGGLEEQLVSTMVQLEAELRHAQCVHGAVQFSAATEPVEVGSLSPRTLVVSVGRRHWFDA